MRILAEVVVVLVVAGLALGLLLGAMGDPRADEDDPDSPDEGERP